MGRVSFGHYRQGSDAGSTGADSPDLILPSFAATALTGMAISSGNASRDRLGKAQVRLDVHAIGIVRRT
jgi:hypothetical protein